MTWNIPPRRSRRSIDLRQVAALRSQLSEESGIEQASSVFPVLGGAMLGIAGAYVLRALAESSVVPRQAIAAVAIAYAVAWLVWAARAKAATTFARAIYAGTSGLILAPMLWELTLRFNVLSPTLTACVLSGFFVVATVLAWKRNLAPVFWMAYGASALTAVALSIATHEMMPFLAALLLMVLLSELAAMRGRAQSIRPLVAAVADVAVWALIFIYSSPQSTRPDYPDLGPAALLIPACLLFLINAAGVAFKTVFLQRKITVFETAQCMAALPACRVECAVLRTGQGTLILGITCLLLSAACYWAGFARFRGAADPRNFRVFAAWSAGLLLAGALWSLPPELGRGCWDWRRSWPSYFGVRQGNAALGLHGVVYLAAAAAASGLLEYAFRALAGPPLARPTWSIFLVSACAVVCYAAGNEVRAKTGGSRFCTWFPYCWPCGPWQR